MKSSQFFAFFLGFFLFSALALAEGSKELNSNGGNRAYLLSTAVNNTSNSHPFPTLGTIKVFVREGESLYLGSSAQGIGNGTIVVRRSDGTTTSSAADPVIGLIANRTQEFGGPDTDLDPATNTGRYTPFIVPVLAGQGGVWEVDFIAPGTGNPPNSISSADEWAPQSNNSAYIEAFDLTVRDAANTTITGRAFMNVLNGHLDGTNARFNAKLKVLTKDGYIYDVDNNGQAGIAFTFFVNNKGFRNGGNATYKSSPSSISVDVHDPRGSDTATDITHKIFFNQPNLNDPSDPADPNTAPLPGGGTTWLLNLPFSPTVGNFSFTGKEGTVNVAGTSSSAAAAMGGFVGFTTNQAGSYIINLDINQNGSFTDPIDRRLTGSAVAGSNSVYWDGLDGQGNKVTGAVTFGAGSMQVMLRAGEVHFPFLDVENNSNGIKITRTNGGGVNLDYVYWDDTNIGGGTRSPATGISSNGTGHRWTGNFGDNRGLDTWTYVVSSPVSSSLAITMKEADLQVVSISRSRSSLCIGQDEIYTVVVRNNGPGTVNGAKFRFTFPSEFGGVSVNSSVSSGTAALISEAISAGRYDGVLDMNANSTMTFIIAGTVTAMPSGNALSVEASVLRPADVTEIDAINTDTAPPTDPLAECNSGPSGVGCNNILSNTTPVTSPNITIANSTISEGSNGGIRTMTFGVSLSAVNPSCDVNLTYSIEHITTSAADFSGATSGTLTIPAGQASATISIPVLSDRIIENDEEFNVKIELVPGSTGGQVTVGTATGTINDDDNAVLNVRVFSHGAEPSTNARFEVYFPAGVTSSVPTTVSYAVSGSAIPDVDYSALTGTVTIPAGSNSEFIDVAVIDDKIVEGPELVSITLSGAVSSLPVTVVPGNTSATIDDDDFSFHRITLEKVADGREGSADAAFAIGFPAGYSSSVPTTVTYSIGGTALNGTDYTAISGSVVIPAGVSSVPVNIIVADDNIIEGDEKVAILLTSAKSSLPGVIPFGPAAVVEAVIQDNDMASISVAPRSNGAEPGTNGAFRVSFPAGITSATPTTVNYTLAGDAINGVDYSNLSGVLVIPANANFADITVTVIDDQIIEGNENVKIKLTSASNGAGGIPVDLAEPVISINDNDNTSPNNFITLSKVDDAAEPGTNARFRVSFPVGVTSSQPTSVAYSISGSATIGLDFTAPAGIVEIPAGSNEAIITIPVIDDLISEPTETIEVTLTSANNLISIIDFTPNNPVSADILDDENIGTNNVIRLTAVSDGAEPSINGLFKVGFPGNISSSVATSVTYVITGTGANGIDYVTLTGTVVIPAGANSAEIPVQVIDDNIIEGTETVSLRLTSATNSISALIVNPGVVSIDIGDDDNVPPKNIVTLSHIQDSFEGGMIGKYLVSFPPGVTSSQNTSVTYSVSGTAANTMDFSTLSGTVIIPAGENSAFIEVIAVDDNIIEGDETVQVVLTGAANAAANLQVTPNTPITLTVFDNDNVNPVVTLTKVRDGAEGGINPQYRVSLPAGVNSSVDTEVRYTISGSAINGTDYATISGTSIIPAGSNSVTIDLNLVDDLIIEGDELVSIQLSSILNAVSPSMTADPINPVTAVIYDNDNVSPNNIVTLKKVLDGSEPGTDARFTISFPVGVTSAAETVVNYNVSGTATNGIDFATLSGTVVIPAGENSATIKVSVIDDQVIEGDETVALTLTSAQNILSSIEVRPLLAETAIIQDDDNTVANNTITLRKDSDGAEPASNARFRVSFPGVVTSTADTRVFYNISGIAINGTDYETLSGSVIIPAGSNEAAIDIIVKDDFIIEGDETVGLQLTSATNTLSPLLLTIAPATPVFATIADDDNIPPNNSITLTLVQNGAEPGTNAVFRVGFPSVPQMITVAAPTIVHYSIGGTALNGTDYAFLNGTVTIPAGSNFADITATVIDDKIIEGTETIELTLNSASNPLTALTVSPATAVSAIIADNDIVPPNNNVTLTRVSDGTEPNINGQFRVSFPAGITSSAPTLLTYSVGGTATPGTDYEALSGSVTIPAGANFAYIDVEVLDDTSIEGNETVELTVTSISNAVAGLTFSPGTPVSIVIQDDEQDPLSPSSVITLTKVLDGKEPGTNAIFKVSYAPGYSSPQPTVVSYTIGGTATANIDYEELIGTVTIPEDANEAFIEISVKDDLIIEPTETVELLLTSAVNPLKVLTVEPAAPVIAYIEDDDNVPPNNVVSIKRTNNGSEPALNGQFEIGFPDGITSSVATTVKYAVSGTAGIGTDYTALAGVVVIPAGVTSVSVDVMVVDDNIIEPAETIMLTLTEATTTITTPLIDPRTVSLEIADDDNTPANNTITLDWVADGKEGNTDGRFTVRFPGTYRTTVDTKVEYSISGTAANGSDYKSLTGVVIIPAGDNSAAIDIDVEDDQIIEAHETVELTIRSATNTLVNTLVVGPVTPVTVTIEDNDSGIPVVLERVQHGSEPTTMARFKVQYDAGFTSSSPSVISYAVGGTASAGTDYPALSGVVTIPAGENQVYIDVPVFDDLIVEDVENVSLTIVNIVSASNPAISFTAGPVAANISDNDIGQNIVSIMHVADGNETGQKVVFRIGYPAGVVAAKPTTITYTHTGGSATPGSDFVAPSGTIVIPPLTNYVLLEIDPINDNLIEVTETVRIELTGADNGLSTSVLVSPAVAVANIADDDSSIGGNNRVSIEQVRHGSEPGDNPQLRVFFPAGVTSTTPTDVRYTVTGSAGSGDDFIALPGMITIPPFTNSMQINVVVKDDYLLESTENVVVTIIDANSIIADPLIDVSTATVNIEDNDNLPIYSTINLEKVSDGAEPSTNARFRVHFPDVFPISATADTRINYTVSGTASNNTDYGNLTGIVVIPAGYHEAFIDVEVKDDWIIEGDETVELTLVSATNPMLGNLPLSPNIGVAATIVDDDDSGLYASISLKAIANAIEGSANGRFEVSLAPGYTSSVPTKINYNITGSAAAGLDYQALSGTVTIPANENSAYVDVEVIDDQKLESLEEVVLTIPVGGVLNDVAALTVVSPAATVTIQDNDIATVSITGPVTVNEGDGGLSVATFHVKLNGETSTGFSIDYATADGTAKASENDFVAVSDKITFTGALNESIPVSVFIKGDKMIERDEDFQVLLSNLSDDFGGRLTVVGSPATGTIKDDDNTATNRAITITKTDGAEPGTDAVFSFNFPTDVSADVDTRIPYTLTGTASGNNVDYTEPAVAWVVIPAGENKGSLILSVVDDLKAEAAESVIINTGGVENTRYAGLSVTNPVETLLIYDNDKAELVIAGVSANEGDLGFTDLEFALVLSAATDGPFDVAYTVNAGTATIVDNDFAVLDNKVSFDGFAGETRKIKVRVTGDRKIEADESFTVTLGAVSNTFGGNLAVSPTLNVATGTIINDDTAEITITKTDGEEGGADASYKFSFPPGYTSDEPVIINYTLGGTATGSGSPIDYTADPSATSITINPNTESVTLTLNVNDDVLVEGEETVTITTASVSSPYAGISLNPGRPVVTIRDNDLAILELTGPTTVAEGAGGTTQLTFTVKLDKSVTGSFDVSYTTANGSALAGEDYNAATGILYFAGNAGEQHTFTVDIYGDRKIEADETFTVALTGMSPLNNHVTLPSMPATVEIKNDDSGELEIVASDGAENGTPGSSPGNFTIRFTDPLVTSSEAISLSYGLSGTANGADFTTGGSPVILPPGSNSIAVQIDVIDDARVEGTETVVLTVNNNNALPAGIAMANAEATLKILDNDVATLSISNAEVTEGNSGTRNLVFDVILDAATNSQFMIGYRTEDGTAMTSDGDYLAPASDAVLTFAGNAGEKQQIIIPVKGDTKAEADEIFSVLLGNLSSNFGGQLSLSSSSSSAIGTIKNDDEARISVTKTDGAEQNEVAAAFTFTLLNGMVSDQPIVIEYTLTGTALGGGEDYSGPTAGSVVIPAGESSATITLPVVDDTIMEGDETVILTVINVDTAYPVIVGAGIPVATIKDNDSKAVLTLSTPVVRLEGNSGETIAVFSVTLDKSVNGGFEINFRTADGTAKAFDGDYVPAAGTLKFDGTAGESRVFEVKIKGDLKLEGNEEFYVLLSGLTNSFGGKLTLANTTATGKIIDDDSASITITKTDGAEGGVPASFTFSFPPGITSSVPTTINYLLSGTATAGGDYNASRTGHVVIPAGWNSTTLNLPVVDDDITEETELVTLHTGLVSNVETGGIEVVNSPQTLEISDNDESILTIVPVTLAENNSRSTMAMFKVVLNSATATPFTTRYFTTDGTATLADDDYTETKGTINFAGMAGEEKNIEVPVTGDINLENNEYFLLSLTDLSNSFDGRLKISGSPARGVIQNDDIPPVAVADMVEVLEDTPTTFSVIANDSDPDGSVNPATIVIVTQPQHGTVKANADGTVTYTPDRDFNGTDRFSYAVKDNTGILSNVAVVEINIPAVNDSPVAMNDTFDVEQDSELEGCVCPNDSDPDGDKLRFAAITDPAHGTLEFRADGTFTYVPVEGFVGEDTFTYEACDPYGSCSTATVTINVSLTTTVSLTPQFSTVEEGRRIDLTISLARPFDEDVVAVLGFEGDALRATDYSLSGKFQSIRIPKGETTTTEKLTIAALSDVLEESDENIVVKIISVSNPHVKIGNDATVVIKDRPFDPNQVENPDIVPEPLVSPNADGQGNDFFHIRNIESFPDNEVVIYNRLGNEVFRMKGYNESDKVFKGVANTGLMSNGTPMVDGVYFYMITTKIEMNGQTVTRLNKGYLILRR